MLVWILRAAVIKKPRDFPRVCLVAVLGMTLMACGGSEDYSDLEASMEAIKRKPSGRIDPPPQFETFETFAYGASLLRSPFQPPIDAEPVRLVLQGKKVEPDFNRPKEVLESFSIESLSMVGTIRRSDKTRNALMQDGKGGIQRITIGNFMGKNHGRVVKITAQQIDLIELIPDGVGGWVERPRRVFMKSKE